MFFFFLYSICDVKLQYMDILLNSEKTKEDNLTLISLWTMRVRYTTMQWTMRYS